ncbi:MAG: hypothetical protein IT356_07480 [Gemmatimonadaceae bacterium]|nr:hypothetical protein [Gemmatimonadaceae bacterium]
MNVPNEDAPAAAISVVREARPAVAPQAPDVDTGLVRAWMSRAGERVTLLGATGHASIDLRGRLAKVHPGEDRAGAAALLDLAAALVLARARALILRASAVMDPVGWVWLVLGEPADRNWLVRAFTADSAWCVSDGSVLLRSAPLKPEILIAETWHRPEPGRQEGDMAPDAPTAEMCRPLGPVRGVLIAQPASHVGEHVPWRTAGQASLAAALAPAMPPSGIDREGDANTEDLLSGLARRLALYVPFGRHTEPTGLRATARLRAALEYRFDPGRA